MSGINRRMGRLQMEEELKTQIVACMLRFVIPADRNTSVRKRKSQSANKPEIF